MCDLGQVTWYVWTSLLLFVRWGGIKQLFHRPIVRIKWGIVHKLLEFLACKMHSINVYIIVLFVWLLFICSSTEGAIFFVSCSKISPPGKCSIYLTFCFSYFCFCLLVYRCTSILKAWHSSRANMLWKHLIERICC